MRQLRYFNMYFRGLRLARTYLPRRFLRCAFSTTRQNSQKLQTLSDSAQKAIWAQHVIRSIMNLPPPTYINDKSSREKIIDLQLPNTRYKFKEENREEVIKMFMMGIPIDYYSIYEQSRVKDALDTKVITPNLQTPLIFCPNYSVTKEIFALLNDPTSNGLIYGGYGISKTIGIIMYSQLVLFKSKFMMEAKNDSEKKRELEELTRQNLIDPRTTSKCWYWTIDQQKLLLDKRKKGKYFLRNLLLKQATELTQQQIQRLSIIQPYQQFQDQLMLIYQQAGINQRVIFDQINTVASKMRQVNVVIQQKQKLITKLEDILERTTEDQQSDRQELRTEITSTQKIYAEKLLNLSSNRQFTQKILEYINAFKRYGKSFTFNSSMNFQLEYLESKYRLPQGMLTFDLYGKHQDFYLFKIDYQQKLQKQSGKIDFYHFFWFQLCRVLLAKKVSLEKLENIKHKAYETMYKQIKIKRYYRFIFINKTLKKNIKKFQTINEKSSQHDIIWLLNQLIKRFDIDCKQMAQNNIINYFKKRQKDEKNTDDKIIENKVTKIIEKIIYKQDEGVDERVDEEVDERVDEEVDERVDNQYKGFNQRFIKLLYMLAEYDVKLGKKRMNYSIQELDFLMQSNVLIYLYDKHYNNQFLPFDVDYVQRTIDFLYSPQEFIQLVRGIVKPGLKKFYSEIWNQKSLKISKRNTSYRGITIQQAFRETLIPKTVIQFPIFNKQKKPKPKENDYRPQDYNNLQVQIYNTSFFTKFTKQSDFFQKMNNILSQTSQQPDQWFSCQPIKELSQNDNKHDSNSPSIDFILVRYSKQKSLHQVYTFDMTIGQNVLKKQNKFLELFDQIFLNSKPEQQLPRLQIVHYIICHRDVIRPTIEYVIPVVKKEKEQNLNNSKSEGADPKPINNPLERMAASCLIDNKITVSYVSLDQMKVVQCFKSEAYYAFKYFQDWTCKIRAQQQAQKKAASKKKSNITPQG